MHPRIGPQIRTLVNADSGSTARNVHVRVYGPLVQSRVVHLHLVQTFPLVGAADRVDLVAEHGYCHLEPACNREFYSLLDCSSAVTC